MLKTFLISLFSVLILDFFWLGFVVKDSNLRQLSAIGRIVDGKFQLMVWPGVIAYILMALSLTVFSVPRAVSSGSGLEAFFWGAGLGLSIYGVYDMTNLAILKDYPLAFALTDMAWGTLLYGSVTWLIGWKLMK